MSTFKWSFSFIVLALALVAVPAEARIVCWTNKEGVKECGDKIPPEYSQESHQQLNEQGMVVEETARAKTEEELAEEKKHEAEQAEKDRIAGEESKRDKILLDTFSSVDDIQMARDGKIAALESSISLTQKRNEKLQADLDKLVEQAAAEERAGKTPSEDLVKDIDSMKKQMETNTTFIADKRKEQEMVTEAYARDMERFKELKSVKE
jgi:hypothetical protein